MIVSTHIKGHVHAAYSDNGEVVLDKCNAIHNKNMAIAIARGLSNAAVDGTTGIATNQIYKLKLGNGGSSVDSMQMITYQPPNVTGANADLYNPTYSEVVDETQVGTPIENSVTFQESPAPDETTIVIVTATIAAGEPNGQNLTDSPPDSNPDSTFAFDELGLFTVDNKLLSPLGSPAAIVAVTITIVVSSGAGDS
jgi:hypothetical protein